MLHCCDVTNIALHCWLQRVSIACYSKRCISYRKSVCLSDRLSQAGFLMANFAAKFQREHREQGRQMREGYEK